MTLSIIRLVQIHLNDCDEERKEMSAKNLLKKVIPVSIKSVIKKVIAPSTVIPSDYHIICEDRKRLEGMRVLVTGATGAIGSALAHRLLLEGATVGVCGRSLDKIHVMCEGFACEGLSPERIIPLIVDVTDDDSIKQGVMSFISACGGIDALVNNAGGSARGMQRPFAEQDFSIIDNIIRVNLRGAMLCTHEVAPKLIKQGSGGRIINMSSVMGIAGAANMCDYAAAKAGIIGFTKSLAIELGSYGITVNCVAPGMVSQHPGEYTRVQRPTDGNRLGRYGTPDEVARLIVYLLSPDADYITGQNVVIDGGRTLGLTGA